MGKSRNGPAVAEQSRVQQDLASVSCKKLPWRQIVALVLGFHLLAFAIVSIRFYSGRPKHASPAPPPSLQANIQASFWLQRPFWMINSSLPQLETDLQNEVGVPNSQVVILSLQSLHFPNWTEVIFGVISEPSNTSLQIADTSLLRETFVELFLQQSVNLSLSTDLFGKAYHFEVLAFPGGITVIPEQSGFPLEVVVLFNFTLHNTLSHIVHNFAKFKQQLAAGISLEANEILYVQLTNVNGSTLERVIIVQTSIIPVVGLMLPIPRLKQLAQVIVASPRANLGLNHSLFGRVRGVELSSYLEYTLNPAMAPSPAYSHSPDDGCKRTYSSAGRSHRHHHHHHPHHQHHYYHHHTVGAPSSSLLHPPRHDYHIPALSPSISPNFQPIASVSVETPNHPYKSQEPVSSAPVVAPPVSLPPHIESPLISTPPFSAQGPHVAPDSKELIPAVGPTPLQDPERKDFVPALSPSSSEALNCPYATMCLLFVILIMFC